MFFRLCGSEDNELITLEMIHLYVEVLDRYFGNVCELDIIFNFHKAYYILDEIFVGGGLRVVEEGGVKRVRADGRLHGGARGGQGRERVVGAAAEVTPQVGQLSSSVGWGIPLAGASTACVWGVTPLLVVDGVRAHGSAFASVLQTASCLRKLAIASATRGLEHRHTAVALVQPQQRGIVHQRARR